MSFKDRMMAETGAPMPRYLYCLLKPAETLAGGVALSAVTGFDEQWTTWAVAFVYVWLGLFLWYRHRRIVITSGPGQLLGDAWYHGLLSLAAVPLVMPWHPLVRLAVFLGIVVTWWVSENAGYGVVRSPDAP